MLQWHMAPSLCKENKMPNQLESAFKGRRFRHRSQQQTLINLGSLSHKLAYLDSQLTSKNNSLEKEEQLRCQTLVLTSWELLAEVLLQSKGSAKCLKWTSLLVWRPLWVWRIAITSYRQTQWNNFWSTTLLKKSQTSWMIVSKLATLLGSTLWWTFFRKNGQKPRKKESLICSTCKSWRVHFQKTTESWQKNSLVSLRSQFTLNSLSTELPINKAKML